MSGPAQVIILGEDAAHTGSLYRAVVDHLNVPCRRVRKLPVSAGRGDAKQCVLKRVAGEISLLRCGPASAALLIMLDGDGASGDERFTALQKALSDAGADPLTPEARVALIVPCRNIETWREFAGCSVVDETTEYKKGRRSAWAAEQYKRVGLFLGRNPCPKENPPPSLAKARTTLHDLFR
jgi:hypothetical protein